MRIVRPAARGNAGSGCCQQKKGHDPAKMASFSLRTTQGRFVKWSRELHSIRERARMYRNMGPREH